MTYHPFIADPDHIARLDGQRFVVLRPHGDVRAVWEGVRAAMKARLADRPVSYPAQAHVTMGGFPAGTAIEAVRVLVEEWARDVPPLGITVERAHVFPTPFQIVVVQVRKTPELFEAHTRLRRLAVERGLTDLLVIPPAEWVFHMSVAYCSSIKAAEWADVAQFVEALVEPAAHSLVGDVEIVAFDHTQEYSGGAFPLSH